MAAVIEAAGPERVSVITDAIAAAGCDDGTFRLGAVPIDVVSGVARVRGTSTVAGSTATMGQVFRNVSALAGLAAAVQMTATTPARALGLERVGDLRAGYDANLVVLDSDLQVTAVMAGGDWRPD
jgi:N-acetylglucosamine-6-phosphate deacetylase